MSWSSDSRPRLPRRPDSRSWTSTGFKVRRRNAFVRDQVVVVHPDRKYAPEELIEIANTLTALDEVVVASPNFVSQFKRDAVPAIRAEEWHLLNKGTGGALKNEDVDIRDAWKITRGKKR